MRTHTHNIKHTIQMKREKKEGKKENMNQK